MLTWGFAISFVHLPALNKSEYIHVEGAGCWFKAPSDSRYADLLTHQQIIFSGGDSPRISAISRCLDLETNFRLARQRSRRSCLAKHHWRMLPSLADPLHAVAASAFFEWGSQRGKVVANYALSQYGTHAPFLIPSQKSQVPFRFP